MWMECGSSWNMESETVASPSASKARRCAHLTLSPCSSQVPWSACTAPPRESCARSSVTSSPRCPAMSPPTAGRRGSGRTTASTSVWDWPSCPASSSAAASSSRRRAYSDWWPRVPRGLVGSWGGRCGWGVGWRALSQPCELLFMGPLEQLGSWS